MKKTTTILVCLFLITQNLFATKHTILTSGFTYSPATTTAAMGDTISIAASTTHPAVQVDQTDWNANTPTPMAGGWGTKTTTYTFVITSTSTIYYGCANHMASMGMKGQIDVNSVGIKTNIAATNEVNLFPNPALNGEFTVKAPVSSSGKLFIYDVTGKQLETYTLTANETKVKSLLSVGEYIYAVLVNQKEIYRSKFFITK